MKIRGTDFVYYQTGDIDRAIAFYRDTLGLELEGYYEQMRWAEFDAGNTTLVLNDPSILGVGIEPRPGGGAAALAVEDLAAAMEELEGKDVSGCLPGPGEPHLPSLLHRGPGRQPRLAPPAQGRHLRLMC